MAEDKKNLRCSFCGKPEGQVHRMIQGPGGVRICDECVQLCMSILDDGYTPGMGEDVQTMDQLPTPREIREVLDQCVIRILNEIYTKGFRHQEQSVRVVERLEKDGEGLNLTVEVRDGILNHSTSGNPSTLEGKIVRLCDKIAYVNSDIDDAIRGKVIKEEDIPREYTEILGNTLRERLNTLIHDLIRNSMDKNDIIQSDTMREALTGLRAFMFENVYVNSVAKAEEGKAEYMIGQLYKYYIDHVEKLPEEYGKMLKSGEASVERVVCDFIAGMTDRYAVATYQSLTIPRTWSVL